MNKFNQASQTKQSVRRRALPALILLALGGLTTMACGDDDEGTGGKSAALGCAYDALEPDLESGGAVGPAVDTTTGSLKLTSGQRYMISSTYGVAKPGEGGAPVTERYQQLFAAIEADLQQRPGLLALQLSYSESCRSGRTLAIWRSEEEMYDFVTGPAHLEAMKAAREVLEPGYAVTHWEATSPDQMTMNEAVRELAKVPPSF